MIPVIAGVPRGRRLPAVEIFDDVKACASPGLVNAHRLDAYEDHRLTSEFTCDTFRRTRILEYEIPKYDGRLGRPNAFVPISVRGKKLQLTISAFSSWAEPTMVHRINVRRADATSGGLVALLAADGQSVGLCAHREVILRRETLPSRSHAEVPSREPHG